MADAGRLADVIVAPATPPGTSALAIVRMSGPAGATQRVARRLAPGLPRELIPRRAQLCHIQDERGAPLDRGLVLFFPAPDSATGEEVVEFSCHGSPAIVAGLLEAARHAGARPAAPGEFTRRALANGKLDLAAAEGIASLVGAESRQAARRSLGLVDGLLSKRVLGVKRRLLDVLAELEAGFDYAEDVPAIPAERLLAALREVRDEIVSLAAGSSGSWRDRFPTLVILGRPNAGKSTLFNALVGFDRAIVASVPGTTRDAVSENVDLGGVRAKLLDTAGLRETADEVERIGVDVARRAGAGADLILYVIESSAGASSGATSAEDGAYFVLPERARTLLVRTKCDLLPGGRNVEAEGLRFDHEVSAVTGEGMPELASALKARLMGEESDGELLVLERHRDALSRTLEALVEAEAAARERRDEFVAASLRRGLHALGEITGETATEELLNLIFSKFCLGK